MLDDSFWLKQTEEALFPEMEWSRPQQKRTAKKLAIIGGHDHGFDAVGRLYQASVQAGIGQIKVVLPNGLKRVVGTALPDAVFAELAPEPKQQAEAKAALMAFADWADGVLPVQTGNNSKTALLLNDLVSSYAGSVVVTDDLAQLMKHDLQSLAQRNSTLFVHSFDGLQHLAASLKSEVGFRHDMGLRPFVLGLRQFGQMLNGPVVAILDQTVAVAAGDMVVTTPRQTEPDPIMLAGWCATWWLQQPTKPLEALATAVADF